VGDKIVDHGRHRFPGSSRCLESEAAAPTQAWQKPTGAH